MRRGGNLDAVGVSRNAALFWQQERRSVKVACDLSGPLLRGARPGREPFALFLHLFDSVFRQMPQIVHFGGKLRRRKATASRRPVETALSGLLSLVAFGEPFSGFL